MNTRRRASTQHIPKHYHKLPCLKYILFRSLSRLCRYKPVIIFSGATGVVIFSLLIWTDTFWGIELVQVLYGTFMAAEVAYFTYIYAKVERSKYQQVTGQTRSAILVGRFLGCLMAQFLVSYQFMDYYQLMYLSLGCEYLNCAHISCHPFHLGKGGGGSHGVAAVNELFIDTQFLVLNFVDCHHRRCFTNKCWP